MRKRRERAEGEEIQTLGPVHCFYDVEDRICRVTSKAVRVLCDARGFQRNNTVKLYWVGPEAYLG